MLFNERASNNHHQQPPPTRDNRNPSQPVPTQRQRDMLAIYPRITIYTRIYSHIFALYIYVILHPHTTRHAIRYYLLNTTPLYIAVMIASREPFKKRLQPVFISCIRLYIFIINLKPLNKHDNARNNHATKKSERASDNNNTTIILFFSVFILYICVQYIIYNKDMKKQKNNFF